MATISNSLPRKHGLSLWCPQSTSIYHTLRPSSIGFRSLQRSYVAASSAFSNENRELVIVYLFTYFEFEFEFEFEVKIDDVWNCVVFVGFWSLEVAMLLAMRLGLSSNTTWPMDVFALCLKRSAKPSSIFKLWILFGWSLISENVFEFRTSCSGTMLNCRENAKFNHLTTIVTL